MHFWFKKKDCPLGTLVNSKQNALSWQWFVNEGKVYSVKSSRRPEEGSFQRKGHNMADILTTNPFLWGNCLEVTLINCRLFFGKSQVSGKEMCAMSREQFCDQTPGCVGDILYNHLHLLQQDAATAASKQHQPDHPQPPPVQAYPDPYTQRYQPYDQTVTSHHGDYHYHPFYAAAAIAASKYYYPEYPTAHGGYTHQLPSEQQYHLDLHQQYSHNSPQLTVSTFS